MTHAHTFRKFALPVAALAAALALTSCGADSAAVRDTSGAAASAGAAAVGDKNEADTLFATMMIPHHAQAVEMADLALTNATDPKVKALASKIKGAQGPEIARMSGWLTGWGEPVPGTAGGSDMSGMSGMGDETGGMMSEQQMTDLGAAKGPGFDRMWLQMMITHHEGAVAMAKDELDKGTNPEAKQLAQAIIDGQSAEIAEMRSSL
ncbi:MAG: DUF305 domain-containing protein [Phycicoccus sp.]|nr:DUF305 domain-containing protein [Phycicoccus sp.]NMM32810.1 DUF305 domain-containing protein [Phycicoccus sp.]